MRFIVATASIGNWPEALSADSMTASAPSNTAWATSDTSARVGTGDEIIDSSICVATTTGLPWRRDMRVMRFCSPGTFSSGISTPRSPRATIRASDISMISSSLAMACGFSILASTRARPRAIFLTSATSSARCTNDTAIQSTPSFKAASRSERSLLVMAETGISVSGRLTPLRFETRPGTSTMASARCSVASRTRSFTLPSSISMTWPGRSARRISGCGRWTRLASPGVGSASRMKVSPLRRSTPVSANCPTRSLGPCRSTRMPIGRPYSASSDRIVRIRSRMASWLAWLMLMRNTSAPASKSLARTERSCEAGPRVARIFTRRIRLIAEILSKASRSGSCAAGRCGSRPAPSRGRRAAADTALWPSCQCDASGFDGSVS